MDATNDSPRELRVFLPPPPTTIQIIRTMILWLLTFVLLALEVQLFRKESDLATAAVLDLCLIIYYHWRPRNVENYTAMENKVTIRILTLVLCITIFLQLVSYSPLSTIPIVILIITIFYLHPSQTFVDKPLHAEGENLYPDWHPPPQLTRGDLERGHQIPPPEPPSQSSGFTTPSHKTYEPQSSESSTLGGWQPTPPHVITYLDTRFENRLGKRQLSTVEQNCLNGAPRPVIIMREDPCRIEKLEKLESSNKVLADKTHELQNEKSALQNEKSTLQKEKSALQTETEKRVLPDDPIIQQKINDAVGNEVDQLLAHSHLILENDPKATLAFVGRFCQQYGFDLFRADGAPADLGQLLQGVTLPQGTQGLPNNSMPGQNGGGFSGSPGPTTVTPAPATNLGGGFTIFGAAGGYGNPTTTTPPIAGPTTRNTNGGFDFGGSAGGPAPTTTPAGFPGGFGAASNPQATTPTAPVQARNPNLLTITFVNQDPRIPSVDIDIVRHQTLSFCQALYRNHKFGTADDGSDLTFGSSYECTFHYKGIELNKSMRLMDFMFPRFLDMSAVTIDVSPAPPPPNNPPKTAPIDPKMLTITFRNTDPRIPTISLPFLREKLLGFCGIIYRNDPRVVKQLGPSYDCEFHCDGFELDRNWELEDILQFEGLSHVTVDVSGT